MKKKGVIIQSSARSQGNTSMVVSYLNTSLDFDIINLNEYSIGHYQYELPSQEDDFRELFIKIVNEYDCLVFATPIYWYTMSGHLKVFFDRISDFLSKDKRYARQLANKIMAVISCGSDDEIFQGFLMPFEQTAKYLNLKLIGHEHTWVVNGQIPESVKSNLENLAHTITKSLEEDTLNNTGT